MVVSLPPPWTKYSSHLTNSKIEYYTLAYQLKMWAHGMPNWWSREGFDLWPKNSKESWKSKWWYRVNSRLPDLLFQPKYKSTLILLSAHLHLIIGSIITHIILFGYIVGYRFDSRSKACAMYNRLITAIPEYIHFTLVVIDHCWPAHLSSVTPFLWKL